MPQKKTVALFVTCLVDTLRPSVAWASVSLIESLGFSVDVPEQQTCCGQPGYNSGHDAKDIAQHQVAILESYDFVVIPSGSCAGMIKNHYPSLFRSDSNWQKRCQALATKTFELSDFLHTQNWAPSQLDKSNVSWAHHSSCSCRREVKTHLLADSLLQKKGVNLATFNEQEVCCGFGGSFSEKFDAIANRMAENKLENIQDSSAENIVSADLGCLLHLEKVSKNCGKNMEFTHLAELLSDEIERTS